MIICSCFVVSDKDIKAAVEDGVRDFRGLRKRLKCSTNCGACYTSARGCFDQCLKDKGLPVPAWKDTDVDAD